MQQQSQLLSLLEWLDNQLQLLRLMLSEELILLICYVIITSLEDSEVLSKWISNLRVDIGILHVIKLNPSLFNSNVLKFGSKDVKCKVIDVSWFKDKLKLYLTVNNDDYSYIYYSFFYFYFYNKYYFYILTIFII
jgi:hypothetical protein